MSSFTEDPVVKRFLAWDKNLRVSDKVRCVPAPHLPWGGESFPRPQLSPQPDASGAPGVSCGVDSSPASARLLWDLSSGLAPLPVDTPSPLFSQFSGIPLCSGLSKADAQTLSACCRGASAGPSSRCSRCCTVGICYVCPSFHQYLLSMVVAYFSRAGLFSWQYQRIHFFLAL